MALGYAEAKWLDATFLADAVVLTKHTITLCCQGHLLSQNGFYACAITFPSDTALSDWKQQLVELVRETGNCARDGVPNRDSNLTLGWQTAMEAHSPNQRSSASRREALSIEET